ncbi:phi13 family phage major tail protein [Virgibacillus natechei]|uniref:Phi13 family phage major tail protein n=1 Tax=Virgibacillus natechei TaxID=1216297 RepID=A0ABS4IBZ1_9BACI|nr:major tail protein [Virgibacillus natechei]MBP1967976.1 phi13 family phage major tail protein [Virgibacillus natechei]UZD14738.1 phage tail protein [Virgibacillus natechei]
MENKTKLVHGLSDFHIAILTEDDKTAVEYESPEELEGAVDVSVNPNTETNTKYADNGAFGVLNSLGDIDVDLTAVDLPQHIQTKIFGHDQSGDVVFSNVADEASELALGFKAQIQGGGHRFYWLLKGKPELTNIEHSTDEGTVESQDTQLTLRFTPLRHNGNWKAQLDSKEVTSAKWFENVVYDEETATAVQGTETTE